MKLAVVSSHVIQYNAPVYREIAMREGVDLKVFYCSRLGLDAYVDRDFKTTVKWDIPLLEGFRHEFLRTRKKPRRPESFWQISATNFDEAMTRFNPDVIFLHAYSHRVDWQALAWGKKHRVPVFMTTDSHANIDRPWWKELLKKIVVGKGVYRRLSGAIYINGNNRDYHLQYGLRPDQLFQGVYAIDRTRLQASVADIGDVRDMIRERTGIPLDAFLVIFSGKLAPHKDPLTLVKAVARCEKAGLNVWALLVGEGSERSRIEAYCRDNDCKQVRLAGFVNQNAIAEFYAAADVIVLPSLYEPHGLVVAEAACFGVPSIVSDQVGCAHEYGSAIPGVNALVFKAGDAEDLHQQIAKLYGDRALHRKMSQAALEIAPTQDAQSSANWIVSAAKELAKRAAAGGSVRR